MAPRPEVLAKTAEFVTTFNRVIIFPFVALLMAVAFLVFLYGCAEYVMNGGNEKAREQGLQHITFGIIGLVVMVTAWAILELVLATIGLNDELNCAADPTKSGCSSAFSVPPPPPMPTTP
jgi:TRAP-type C4-dicarboxylate transport system permease small subunit